MASNLQNIFCIDSSLFVLEICAYMQRPRMRRTGIEKVTRAGHDSGSAWRISGGARYGNILVSTLQSQENQAGECSGMKDQSKWSMSNIYL
jgi:hypothetical protein